MLSTENLVNGYKLSDCCITLRVVQPFFDWPCSILITISDMSLTCFVITAKQKENKNILTPSFTHNGIDGIKGVLHMVSEHRLKHLGLSGLKNDSTSFCFCKLTIKLAWDNRNRRTHVDLQHKYSKVKRLQLIMYWVIV